MFNDKKNGLFLFFFTLFFSTAHYSRSDTPIIPAMISQNIALYPYIDFNWQFNDDRLKDLLDRVLAQKNNLQEYSRRSITFKIFEKFFKKHYSKNNNVHIDASVLKDLAIFCGQPSDGYHYLANIVDSSTTIFGKVRLYGLLALPTHEKKEFLRKQSVIKKLLEDATLQASLLNDLAVFQSVENNVLSFWFNDPLQHIITKKFFNYSSKKLTSFCNNSSFLLQLRSLLEHEQRILETGVILLAAGLLPIYGIEKIAQRQIFHKNVTTVSEKLYGAGGSIFNLLQHYSDDTIVTGSLAIISGLISTMYAKESVEWTYDNFLLDQIMYERIKDLGIALNAIKNCYLSLKDHPEITLLLERDFHHLESIILDKEITSFFTLIKYFENKTPIFINMGTVLLTFKSCFALKEKLETLFMAFGAIDAFCSIAQLYQKHENTSNSYCFVECIEQTDPMISLTDFWYPCIKAKEIIKNSIQLGDKQQSHMIITGPNAGGKSTILKGIAAAVLMAQAFSIAPAKHAKITPFGAIMTYLNITDDLASGNSLFKNQVLRIQKIFEVIRTLPPEQKALIILDEMFNGASPQEAEACSYGVAYILAEKFSSKVMNIISTHHQTLTLLPNVLSSYKNYHVSIKKDDHGHIFYPFKLEEGISNQHIALDILINEGFDIPFIQKAKSFLKS
ncbi:hypothetical protein HYV11_01180 [Candidatus Dependentiae bacterium]|nr:hypothetical protein [Candidatus Dependentiae bacterium]